MPRYTLVAIALDLVIQIKDRGTDRLAIRFGKEMGGIMSQSAESIERPGRWDKVEIVKCIRQPQALWLRIFSQRLHADTPGQAFWIPLHQGSPRDHVEINVLLLEHGAEIIAEAAEHMSALQLTTYCGMEAAAEALVASGTDASMALAVALCEGHQGIVDMTRR